MGADECEPDITTPIHVDFPIPITDADMTQHVGYKCTSPSGKDVSAFVSRQDDGRYSLDVDASESGVHTLVVTWDGKEVSIYAHFFLFLFVFFSHPTLNLWFLIHGSIIFVHKNNETTISFMLQCLWQKTKT